MDDSERYSGRETGMRKVQFYDRSKIDFGDLLFDRQALRRLLIPLMAEQLLNTLMGMAIDIEKRKSLLSIGTGGLSGPAVKPVALRMVHQVSKAVKIPVIGLGGICNYRDAIEFFMAGATAIEIGTANFLDPAVTVKVRDGVNQWLDDHGCKNIQEIIGVI